MPDLPLDPELDLELTRFLKAPPAKVWRCWTEPALICQWFCPAPWGVTEAVADLRPGGRFYTLMKGPAGEVVPNEGSFLDLVPERRLVFTDLFHSDYRPAAQPGLGFSAIVTFAPEGSGTRYTARARHRSPAERQGHERMGFHEGWGAAAGQLDALAVTL